MQLPIEVKLGKLWENMKKIHFLARYLYQELKLKIQIMELFKTLTLKIIFIILLKEEFLAMNSAIEL